MAQTVEHAFGILMDIILLMDSRHLDNAEKADVMKEMVTHLPIEHVAPNVHRVTKAAVARWLHQLESTKSQKESTDTPAKPSSQSVDVAAAKSARTKPASRKNITASSKGSAQRQKEDFQLA